MRGLIGSQLPELISLPVAAVVSKIYIKSVIMVTPDDTELSGKSVSKKMTENFLQAPWVTLGDLPWVLGHFPRAR